MSGRDETLVLYSKLAFYPVHALALEEIARRYCVRPVVLAAPPPSFRACTKSKGRSSLWGRRSGGCQGGRAATV